MDGKAQILIPQVFITQRLGIVFRVTGYKDLAAALGLNCIDTSLLRGCDDSQIPYLFDILTENRGVAGVRNHEGIIKAPEQNRPLVVSLMGIDTKELLRQRLFVDTIVIIKTRLSTPTDMEGGMDIGLAPLHDLAKLLPIIHIFKGHLLHRRTGNNHAIEFPIL